MHHNRRLPRKPRTGMFIAITLGAIAVFLVCFARVSFETVEADDSQS